MTTFIKSSSLLLLLVSSVVVIASTDTPTVTITPNQVGAGLFFQGEQVSLSATLPTFATSDNALVIIAGPQQNRRISQKTRQTGIWLNGPDAELENAPGYLAVFSSIPVSEFNFNNQANDLQALLDYLPAEPDTNSGINPADQQQTPENLRQWQAAYGQLLQNQRLLINRQNEPPIDQIDQVGQLNLQFTLPSSAPTGQYQVTVLLNTTLNGSPSVNRIDNHFELIKVGLVKQLEQAAFTQPVLYGMGSLLFALLFGWLIGVVFNRR